MQSLWQDVRYTARMMRRSPLYTAAAVGTLAIGIGATTAIFSVVHATLLRELPFHEPDRIVRVYESFRTRFTRGVANPANFDYWERHATSFSHISAIRHGSATLTGAGDAASIRVVGVTPAFFDVMGMSPAVGRRLTTADAAGVGTPVLLAHELWTTRFGADQAITQRTVILDGVARPVAGVMPAGFDFPNQTDVWESFDIPPAQRASARSWYLGVVARMKPGVTAEAAQAEMDRVAVQLQTVEPARQKDRGAYVVPLREDLVYRMTDGLALLQGAVLLVLLIAVANVANLMLAHSSGRRREFNVRAAVGASRARMLRQVLTESLLLGVAGAAAGALLAVGGVKALVALSPRAMPATLTPAVDGPVLAFALAAGLITSVIFGVAPAVFAARTDVAGAAKEGSHTTIVGAGGKAGRLRAALVVAEVALAVTLLAGAGLLIRSFTQLMMQDIGFRADRVLTAQTTLPSARYDTPGKRLQFWGDLFERLESIPGVTAAGGSTALPFSNWEWQTGFRIVGRESVPNEGTSIRTVHPGYFATLGIPLLHGRLFTDADGPTSEKAVLVNQSFARAHLDGLDPVGQRIRFTRDTQEAAFQIVGVVGSTRHYRLEEEAKPEVYRPLALVPPQMFVLAIRTSGDPRGAASLLRAAIREVDRDLPVEQLMTMDALIGRTVAERRFYLLLMAFFSGVAMLLAVVGIYGVMAQAVGQRTREIGIRMALGAAPAHVQRMVLRSGAGLIGSGLLLGTIGALATSSVLRSQLFGVTPRDPLTLIAVIGILGGLGLAATYVPARRARRLDPIVALRRE